MVTSCAANRERPLHRATSGALQLFAPGLGRWLHRVFGVLGGYLTATGTLPAHLAATAFRTRARAARLATAVAGAASTGSMAVANALIDSAFKAPLAAVAHAEPWQVALQWRGR